MNAVKHAKATAENQTIDVKVIVIETLPIRTDIFYHKFTKADLVLKIYTSIYKPSSLKFR